MAKSKERSYKPIESKYKGGATPPQSRGAREMYVTYDLEQETRGDKTAIYPKVKRFYIAGDVKDWKAGKVKKRTGRKVSGVAIEYEQTRKGYRRSGYTAERDGNPYKVKPTTWKVLPNSSGKLWRSPKTLKTCVSIPSQKNYPGNINAPCKICAKQKYRQGPACRFLLTTKKFNLLVNGDEDEKEQPVTLLAAHFDPGRHRLVRGFGRQFNTCTGHRR